MRLINKDNIEIVDSFIRMYGDTVKQSAPHFDRDIEFRLLKEKDNDYRDIMGRLGRVVYYSPEEVGNIGLSTPEILASLAHEVGHIVYGTCGWQPDCEQRADSFAAELGLGAQMISAIGKLLDSRRYPRLTRSLVDRIHFLQNMERSA